MNKLKIPAKAAGAGKEMQKALASLTADLVKYGFHGSEASHNALTVLKMNCLALTPEQQQAMGSKSKKVSNGHLLAEAFTDLIANYMHGRGMYTLKNVEALEAWLSGLNITVSPDAFCWVPGTCIGNAGSNDTTVYIPGFLPENVKAAIAEFPGLVRPLTDEARQSLKMRFNSISAKDLLNEAIFWLTVKYAAGRGELAVRNVDSLKVQLLTLGAFDEGLLHKVK